jgi:integrase
VKAARREPEFHQLCAIVRQVLLADPTLSDFDWKEETKQVLSKQGWAEPATPEVLDRALTQVEQSLRQTLGPRPVPGPTPRPSVPPFVPPEGRTNRPLGWDRVIALQAKLRSDAARSLPSRPEPREWSALAEGEVLNEFWRAAATGDRLALLQTFAELALVREAGWDPTTERATPHDLRRTHGSTITALGFGRDAMNRVQNHKEGGIASVYDRHQYAEENKRVMEATAARIMMLVNGAVSNVVAASFGR